MGNLPKITKWRRNGDPDPDWREDLLFLVIVGKRGKMEE